MQATSYASVEKQYPVLYWTAVAYIVGLPNFLHFDPSGRASESFNFTSIMGVVQSLLTGYILVLLLLLDRRRRAALKPAVPLWIWLVLGGQFLLSSLLQPGFRITPHQPTDLPLAMFFLGQWAVAFCILYVLYSRAMPFDATAMVVQLLGRVSWIWICMTWLILPIMPSQVYGGAEDNASQIHQLGGELIHPGKLATLAGIGFFYALLYFPRSGRRWLALFFALVTLVLTRARTSQAGFVFAFVLFTLFFTRKALLRWGAAFLLLLTPFVGFAFRHALLRYISRGQSMQTLSSLDDRSRIWSASFHAIARRPLLGYGYVVGAKKALRDYWQYTHWIPPHPHNEFIGAALDGGALALCVTVVLYLTVLWKLFPTPRKHPMTLFLFMVYLEILIATISGPILSYRYQTLGGVFLLCSIAAFGVRDAARKRTRKPAPAARIPATAPSAAELVTT